MTIYMVDGCGTVSAKFATVDEYNGARYDETKYVVICDDDSKQIGGYISADETEKAYTPMAIIRSGSNV